MTYSAEVSRTNPSCFMFIIDQSGSMQDVMDPTNIQPLAQPIVGDGRTYTHSAQGPTKAEKLADALNNLIRNLIIACTKSDGVRDYYYISVLGYGRTVGPALGGQLSGRELAPISEVADNPVRVEDRSRQVEDGAGGLVTQAVKFPVWIEPKADGETPMCAAFARAQQILSTWLADHPNSFPPVVIHITDGESSDGDPLEAMKTITTSSSTDGSVLLLNLHLSSNPDARQIQFPDSKLELPDEHAKVLFEAASVLIPAMRSAALQQGIQISDGARGFILNADMVTIIKALEIGTKPGNNVER